ncbi:hypothetical protein EHO59_06700 [Leptospira semungkisensis]|uniref:Uncharacterized protein n=1 Tax=Leptospira semungkisensis TaxID=2484985 RepID=A0A4R9G820_9LEPT|nr:hypothetical protein [Leptospira semungkisensis]TGK07782.1 hypothetical protein EHO59_06700 [Leptospira semungkisensis]
MFRINWVKFAMGLSIFLGFGAYAVWTGLRWMHWPTTPVDMTISEAIMKSEENPWIRLTDGEWHCRYAYTEKTFSYISLTDGKAVVLVGYEDEPKCPPSERPSGAFREIASPLLEQLVSIGFKREALVAPETKEQRIFVLFTHEGPGNFMITVPVLVILSLIGLAYLRTGIERVS